MPQAKPSHKSGTWTCPGCGATYTKTVNGKSFNMQITRSFGSKCRTCARYTANGYLETP